jgi:hypothetical protein
MCIHTISRKKEKNLPTLLLFKKLLSVLLPHSPMFSIKGVCIGANTIITSQFDLTLLVECFCFFLGGGGGGRRELQLRTRIGAFHFFPANSKRIGTL